MRHRGRWLPTVASVVLALAACERPGDRAPAGYVDACYGGQRDMERNWVLSDQRMTITVHGQQRDWPLLARIVEDVGVAQHLKVFDTSASGPSLRSLEVSACDESGLYVRIDKRVWANPNANFGGDSIVTVLNTYHKNAHWQPVAEALVAAFHANWPGMADVKYPPLVPDEQKALPDSMRADLER